MLKLQMDATEGRVAKAVLEKCKRYTIQEFGLASTAEKI
jgi:hypothetical protein